MPTYEYRCKCCDGRMSIHRDVEDRDLLPDCPWCDEEGHHECMVRTFSFQMAPVFQERYEPSLGVTVSSNRALMDEATSGALDHWHLAEKIRSVIDPENLIAPGRYQRRASPSMPTHSVQEIAA